jgi:DNA-binding transcriptional MerR regulator
VTLLSTVEAARKAHVTPARIRDWKRRALLTPADYDRRGWPLYCVTDVLQVERDTRREPRRRRLIALAARDVFSRSC